MASPSPIPRRLLLALLGLVAVVVGLLWWPQPEDGARATAQENADASELQAAQFAADQGAGSLLRTDARKQEIARSADQSTEDLLQPHIEVRLWVTISDEEVPGFAPPSAEAWTAVAQIWFEQTGETERIEIPFNAHGKATFRFWEDTHVDWFGAIPPTSSAYGFDRHEGHEDYTLGTEEDLFLEVGFGGMLQGRVVNPDGKALAGIPVHLMHDNGAALDFVPGYLQTETDAEGQFRFGRLAEGNTWTVAVPPGEWLMIDPSFEDIGYGAGAADVSADPLPADVGTLVVMRGKSVDLQVVDSLGQGVPGVFVDVVPVQYFDPQFRTPDLDDFGLGDEPEQAVDLAKQSFLTGKSVFEDPDWGMEEEWDEQQREDPYGYDYGFLTGRDGHAALHLLPGKYLARLEEYPGQYQLPEAQHGPLLLEFSTEQSSLRLSLPITLGSVRGRLLDQNQQAVAHATINVYNDYQDLYVRTDQEGRFVANHLPLNAPALIELWDSGDEERTFANASWTVFPSVTDEERVFSIQEALSFWVYVREANGLEMPGRARLRLLNWYPNEDTPPTVDPDWLRHVSKDTELGTGFAAYFGNLLPGNVEIALYLPDPWLGMMLRASPCCAISSFSAGPWR